MPPDAQLQKIKEILENHRGKNNQISAGEIGRQIGIEEDATHVQTRGLIRQTIEQLQLPVAGGNRWYYLTYGTRTALGDPIEIAVLTRAYRRRTDKTGYCAIG